MNSSKKVIETKKKHINNSKQSKFAPKYEERIKSIKESDERAMQRKEMKLKERAKRETENIERIPKKRENKK